MLRPAEHLAPPELLLRRARAGLFVLTRRSPSASPPAIGIGVAPSPVGPDGVYRR